MLAEGLTLHDPRVGRGGSAFNFEVGPGEWLAGVEVATRVSPLDGRAVVVTLTPVCRSDAGPRNGPSYGGNPGADQIRRWRLLAKDGYAVGGMVVVGDHLVRGVKIIFMRTAGGRLDVTDRYESEWAGDRGGAPAINYNGEGQPAVGVRGRSGSLIDALGPVFAESPPLDATPQR
jgi:hypothetical protein